VLFVDIFFLAAPAGPDSGRKPSPRLAAGRFYVREQREQRERIETCCGAGGFPFARFALFADSLLAATAAATLVGLRPAFCRRPTADPTRCFRVVFRNRRCRGAFKRRHRMSILGWLVLGLIAGFIASKVVNHSGSGMVMDIVLGIVGAMVGGFLFSLFGAAGVTGFNIYSMLVAVIGAVVLLWVYHAFVGRRAL
jgi:uncharacterized membrane protein YeaQ/YmgE (transglycosylase-associated protein family)